MTSSGRGSHRRFSDGSRRRTGSNASGRSRGRARIFRGGRWVRRSSPARIWTGRSASGVRRGCRGSGSNLVGEATNVRVLFTCSGVGIMNRGIETFFREAFDGLRGVAGIEARLVKGAGGESPAETVVWNLPRTGRLARWLGTLAR